MSVHIIDGKEKCCLTETFWSCSKRPWNPGDQYPKLYDADSPKREKYIKESKTSDTIAVWIYSGAWRPCESKFENDV